MSSFPSSPSPIGDDLTHRFNPELGTGRVTAIEGRVLIVQFAGATLRFAVTGDAPSPGAGKRANCRSSSGWRQERSTTLTTS